MLPIKKIYIDSRYKSGDSASDSNFYIDLPVNMVMPDNTSSMKEGTTCFILRLVARSRKKNNAW